MNAMPFNEIVSFRHGSELYMLRLKMTAIPFFAIDGRDFSFHLYYYNYL